MRRICHPNLIAPVLLAWAMGAHAQGDEAGDAAPTAAQVAVIRKWIGELDAEGFREREAAVRELERIGPAAIPLLEEAMQQGGPEVRFRAAALVKSLRTGPQRDALEAFCAQSDAQLDVEHGMWLIARILDPGVKKVDLARQLDAIAAQVREKLGKDVKPATADPEKVIVALQRVLFEELKFVGNEEDYTNPDNSSLQRVLATRKGLPILLAHVTITVARRLDVPIVGLPMPGMYIVKYDGARAPAGFPKTDIFFDPYRGGRILTREDRVKLYPSLDPDKLLPPGTGRESLIRMLHNLSSHLDHKPERDEQLQQVLELLQRLEAHRPKVAKQPVP